MSAKLNLTHLRLGFSATEANNITLYVPDPPDGTLRIARGVETLTDIGFITVNGLVANNFQTSTAGTAFTVSTALGAEIECITNNAQAHTLPLGSTMPVGGEITFTSQTQANTVSRAESDVIRLGAGTVTSVPLNPGTTLRFKWSGTEWKLTVTPTQGFLHSYTAGDIGLNVGESCYLDFSAVTTAPLRIATATEQIYEINCTGTYTTAAAAGVTYLQPNNQNYVNNFVLRQFWGTGVGTGASGIANIDNGFRMEPGGASIYNARMTVQTRTASKRSITNAASSTNNTSYISVVGSEWIDTTTVWSSLGSIILPNAWTGRVTVRRVQ